MFSCNLCSLFSATMNRRLRFAAFTCARKSISRNVMVFSRVPRRCILLQKVEKHLQGPDEIFLLSLERPNIPVRETAPRHTCTFCICDACLCRKVFPLLETKINPEEWN